MTSELIRHNTKRDNGGVIVLDVIDPDTESEIVTVCIPKFAWVVARSYWAGLAQEKSSYQEAVSQAGYYTPDDTRMDEIRELIDLALLADDEAGGSNQMAYVGEIRMFAMATLPSGWIAFGSNVSKNDYPELWEAIGDTWGATEDDFNVPFLGYMPMDLDVWGNRVVGDVGGSETVTLTLDEIPSHRHQLSGLTSGSGSSTLVSVDTSASGSQVTNSYTTYAGSSGSHNNLPPYQTFKFAIYGGGD